MGADVFKRDGSYKVASEEEAITFNEGFIEVTEQDLVRWLDRKLRQPDILQGELIQFLAKLVENLLQAPNLCLTALVRNKVPLLRASGDMVRAPITI